MINQHSVLSVLRSELPRLRSVYSIKSLTVYGSVARGEEKVGSDVDIVVEFDRVPSLFDLARISSELEQVLGRHVDLTTPGGLHPSLRRTVQREGLNVEA